MPAAGELAHKNTSTVAKKWLVAVLIVNISIVKIHINYLVALRQL